MNKVFLFLVVNFVISIIWQKKYNQKTKSFVRYKNFFSKILPSLWF